MGTRSVTIVMDDDGDKELCRIYRQYDGYPEGHGRDLTKLCDVEITNGIRGDGKGTANGMGCLAAQIVMGLKQAVKHYKGLVDGRPTYDTNNHVGNIYLESPGGEIGDWVEYIYTVRGKEGERPTIECSTRPGEWPFNMQTKDGLVFAGTSKEWRAYLKNQERAA
jgi:hypothetical protein